MGAKKKSKAKAKPSKAKKGALLKFSKMIVEEPNISVVEEPKISEVVPIETTIEEEPKISEVVPIETTIEEEPKIPVVIVGVPSTGAVEEATPTTAIAEEPIPAVVVEESIPIDFDNLNQIKKPEVRTTKAFLSNILWVILLSSVSFLFLYRLYISGFVERRFLAILFTCTTTIFGVLLFSTRTFEGYSLMESTSLDSRSALSKPSNYIIGFLIASFAACVATEPNLMIGNVSNKFKVAALVSFCVSMVWASLA